MTANRLLLVTIAALAGEAAGDAIVALAEDLHGS
jgi:hypothetical protein